MLCPLNLWWVGLTFQWASGGYDVYSGGQSHVWMSVLLSSYKVDPTHPWALSSSWFHSILYNGCQQESLLGHPGSLSISTWFFHHKFQISGHGCHDSNLLPPVGMMEIHSLWSHSFSNSPHQSQGHHCIPSWWASSCLWLHYTHYLALTGVKAKEQEKPTNSPTNDGRPGLGEVMRTPSWTQPTLQRLSKGPLRENYFLLVKKMKSQAWVKCTIPIGQVNNHRRDQEPPKEVGRLTYGKTCERDRRDFPL